MSPPARASHLLWLRRGLLALLVLVLAGLAGLYVFGRAGRPTDPTAGAGDGESAGKGDVVLEGEGFSYELTREGRPVLRISGERMLSDRQENVTLEGVALTLLRADGASYELESERGTYNLRTEQTELAGAVRLAGPDGLELRAAELTVHRGQRLESAGGPVRFRYGGRWGGRADSLLAQLENRFYLLDGDVRIDSIAGPGGPAGLRCDRLLFEREDGIVRALGEVRLHRGFDFLTARRLAVHLGEDGGVGFVRAQYDLRGHRREPAADGGEHTTLLWGNKLSVTLDEARGEPVRAELESPRDRAPAALMVSGPEGIARRVAAPFLIATFADGDLEEVVGSPQARLEEFPADAARHLLSWACGDVLRASFDPGGGAPALVVLDGSAELWRDGVHARGERITARPAADTATLSGAPVRLLTEDGELEAPRVVREGDAVRAEGGVRAVFQRGSPGSLRQAGEEPVRLEAARALWDRSSERILFRDDVRVWQGDSLLIAQAIEERAESEILTAVGGVRTLWHGREGGKEPADAGAEPGAGGSGTADAAGEPTVEPDAATAEQAGSAPDATEGGATEERGPVEVVAEAMVYDRPGGVLLYRRAVAARRGSRSLRCDDMAVEIDPEGEVERMVCRGSARVSDRANDREVTGDIAVYDLASDEVRVSGERVQLTDRDGTTLEGSVMVYDFATGDARVESPDVAEPAARFREEVRVLQEGRSAPAFDAPFPTIPELEAVPADGDEPAGGSGGGEGDAG